MEIKQMEYFVACVNAGSFSKASELLYINQSNISRSIQALEKELNVTLFLRGHKGLVLTLEGEKIYNQVREILEKIGGLGNYVRNGSVSAFSVVTFPSNYVAYAFSQVCMRHEGEGIAFRLSNSSPSNILKQVDEGVSDIGFMYRSDSIRARLDSILSKRNLEFTPISPVVPCIYIGSSNPLVDRKKLTIEQIQKIRFIKDSYDYLESNFELYNTVREYRIERNLADAAIVDSGFGVTQMLRNTDFGYIGHAWIDEKTKDFLKTNMDDALYNHFFPLSSHDGEIEVGYVTKTGMGKTAMVQELIHILDKDIRKV